jgi:hypothetical protein
MQLLDLFLLIWNDRNSGGLGTLLVYCLPVALTLASAIWAVEASECSNSSIHN